MITDSKGLDDFIRMVPFGSAHPKVRVMGFVGKARKGCGGSAPRKRKSPKTGP